MSKPQWLGVVILPNGKPFHQNAVMIDEKIVRSWAQNQSVPPTYTFPVISKRMVVGVDQMGNTHIYVRQDLLR